MAKTKNQKRKSKNLFLKLLIVAAVVAIGAFSFAKYIDFDQIFGHNKTPIAQQEEHNIEEYASDAVVPSAAVNDGGDGKDEIAQYEGENPNQSESLTGNITYAGVVNKKIMIRVNIDQFLNNGTCTLIMQKDEMVYSEKVNIIESASTSTCKGFDIPIDKLAPGDWFIEIEIQSGNKTGSMKGSIKL